MGEIQLFEPLCLYLNSYRSFLVIFGWLLFILAEICIVAR